MIIAVDAMGGDQAPRPLVEGAAAAVRERGSKVVLVGDRAVLEAEIRALGLGDLPLPIKHCTEVVLMEESPSVALRKKRDSSIRVAFDLVKQGEAMGVVSAGNSGATMAHAMMALRTIEGVERPAIATVLPGSERGTVLLDAGANVECQVHHLVLFGLMGHAYAHDVLGIERPRVAILANGEEDSKGTNLTRGASELLRQSSIHYVGYVEPNDVLTGNVDVVVTDGFTGNILLKGIEGTAKWITRGLERHMRASWRSKIGYLLARPAFAGFKKESDVEEYGGAPLLGVNGAAIICHGAAGPRAIMNAIRLAENVIEQKVNLHILQALESSKDLDRLANRPAARNLWAQLRDKLGQKTEGKGEPKADRGGEEGEGGQTG